MYPQQQKILDLVKHQPETLDETAYAVMAVINNSTDQRGNFTKLLGFAWQVQFTNNVSCSHHAPLGQRTNWGGRELDKNGQQLARNFPGFYGRVWFRYAEDYDTNAFHQLDATLTYTGTGGSGSYDGPCTEICSAHFRHFGFKDSPYPSPKCFSYDYRLFLSDWPGLAKDINAKIEQHRKEAFWAKLQNQSIGDLKWPIHKFSWHDPDTQIKDQEFLEKYSVNKIV